MFDSIANWLLWNLGVAFELHTERIIKLQKRAARMILKCNLFTPSKEVFHRLKWLPFNHRVMYFKCVFMFKRLNRLSSNFYSDTFLLASSTHNYHTRYAANINLAIPTVRTEYFKHSLHYSSILLWNSLPIDIKLSQSLDIFKRKLKAHLFKCHVS